MKVLYLATPAKTPDRLTPYTFVDEEVLSLADRGISMYLLADAATNAKRGDPGHPNVHLLPMPDGSALADLPGVLALLARYRAAIPGALFASPRKLLQLGRLERFIAASVRRHGIDVMHSNFGWPGGFGGVLARASTQCPLVATCRGMDVLTDPGIGYGLRRSAFYDAALRAQLATADRTTHVSDYIRQEAIALGAQPERATTVMKGVDVERFRPLDRTRDNDVVTILTVGGLIARKGVDVILRALALLKKTHRFRFQVVGDGKERAALEALAAELDLSDCTEFVGKVSRDDVVGYFARSDIFVLASIWEASGNVLLEALASGKPVVTTDSGGPPEYVTDGQSGFIVPVRDAERMAERLGTLIDDAGMRQRFGAAGRERAVNELTYARMIDSISGIYRTLADGDNASSTTRVADPAGEATHG